MPATPIERVAGQTSETAANRIVLVIDDGEELFESPSATALATLARRGRDSGLRVMAAVEPGQRSRVRGLARRAPQGPHGPPRSRARRWPASCWARPSRARSRVGRCTGFGYLVRARGVELVQVAQH